MTASPSSALFKPLKSVSTRNIEITEVGCVFSSQETEEEVSLFVNSLKRVDKTLPFILGDIYNKYPEVIQNSYDPHLDDGKHYSIGSIRVYASTLKNWPKEERLWTLGISFYQAVYHLSREVRDGLMNDTAIQGLSRNELRQRIRAMNLNPNNSLPPAREDLRQEQDQYIYELEQKIVMLELELENCREHLEGL